VRVRKIARTCKLFRALLERVMNDLVVRDHRARATAALWHTGEATAWQDGARRLPAFGHDSLVLFPHRDGIVALAPGAESNTINVRTVLLGRGPAIEAVEISRIISIRINDKKLAAAMQVCGCRSWRHHILDHLENHMAKSRVLSCQVDASPVAIKAGHKMSHVRLRPCGRSQS
jgi:hypothetical protein